MKVFVNNKPFELMPDATIVSALQAIQILHSKGIAVAVNNSVISKHEWETFLIHENDQIMVIRATQGG